MAQRMKSLEPPYSEGVLDAFRVVMPPGMEPLNIFRTVANNERVLSRMVNGGLLDRGSVSVAQRELVILRACAVCKAEYEWGVHVAAFSTAAGFSAAQIADTCSDIPDASLWSAEQRVLIRMVDELHHSATLSDESWAQLSESLSEPQLVEVIMLAGLYHAVSFVVNGLKVEREKFAPGFPPAQCQPE